MDGVIKIIFTRKSRSPAMFLLVSQHNSSFDNFPRTFLPLSLNGSSSVCLSLFIRVYPKALSSVAKVLLGRGKRRERKFIGTRSALTRGKRNRYRDKMVGNSQSAHPLDLDALPFLRSARVHRAKRG